MVEWFKSLFERKCTLPPEGWRCTRRGGHDGPCAVVAKDKDTFIDAFGDIADGLTGLWDNDD